MNSTQPLTTNDLELLRSAGAARALQTCMGVLLLLCFGAMGALMIYSLASGGYGNDMTVFICMATACLVVAAAICVWLWRQQCRVSRPMRAAILQNQKRIVCGTLGQVEVLPKGRLRYKVDGRSFEVDLLLGEDTRVSHLFGRSLKSFEHLQNVPVELHCIALGANITLLLQARYPTSQPAARNERPAMVSDRRQAGKPGRAVTLGVACGGLLAVLVTALVFRHLAFALVVMGSIATIAWIVTMLVFVLPRSARIRNSARVVSITGPVTEIITAPVRHGRTASSFDVRWYRVGGELFCPLGAGVEDARASLGQTVKFEFLGKNRHCGAGMLMGFETIAAPPAHASGHAPADA